MQKNQFLLSKNTLKLKTQKPIKYKGEFESAILTLVSPQPNSHVFELDMLPKYKLWKYNNRYNYFEKHDTDKKIIKHKVEKPVLLDTFLVHKSEKQIRQFLINQGYYFSTVKSKIFTDSIQKMANVEYSIDAGKSYYINKVSFNSENDLLRNDLFEISLNTLIKRGTIFTNNMCGLERERIYKIMRNKGYYDFKSDNISFIADSANKNDIKKLLDDPFESSLNYKVDTTINDSIEVLINITKTKDSTYFLKYNVDSIIVSIGDYSNPFNEEIPYTTSSLDDIIFRYQQLPINRNVLARNIFILPHSLFNTSDQEATINRLNQLNVFNNVNIKYEKNKLKNGSLTCYINLSVIQKYEIQGLGDISTSDGYLLGFGASATLRDKNVLHGGNQFSIRGAYAIQYQKNNITQDLFRSANNANISSNIIFPKFIVPFYQNKFSKKNIPFSILSLNLNYNNKIGNYKIFSLSSSFGYSWREPKHKNWLFNPSFLTLNIVPDTSLSQEFKVKKANNSYLRSIFSSNIIYGENMTFQFTSSPKNMYGNYTTLKIGAEEAGTILKGINSLYHSVTNEEIKPIAHYIRLDFDLRKYINFRKSQWANRVLVGIGVPIKDTTLPYIKQYSAGGPFSIRGWYARRLGPGHSADSIYNTTNGRNIDRTGDLKLEANTEYRFNLLKLFSGAINIKGAGFMDAGNIWMYHKSNAIPGGEFNINYFFNDLAVAAGYGLRFDFSFFIFRLDVGFPIKKPSLNTNYGFQFDHLKLKYGAWQIAINYPF